MAPCCCRPLFLVPVGLVTGALPFLKCACGSRWVQTWGVGSAGDRGSPTRFRGCSLGRTRLACVPYDSASSLVYLAVPRGPRHSPFTRPGRLTRLVYGGAPRCGGLGWQQEQDVSPPSAYPPGSLGQDPVDQVAQIFWGGHRRRGGCTAAVVVTAPLTGRAAAGCHSAVILARRYAGGAGGGAPPGNERPLLWHGLPSVVHRLAQPGP